MMSENWPLGYVNLSLFGSVSRGTSDSHSDIDILAIVRDGHGKQPEDPIVEWCFKRYGVTPSISWYGLRKIHALFEAGDLFAWHLYLESSPLPGFNAISVEFGEPKDFKEVSETISDLLRILQAVPECLARSPWNAVFEAGVVYVCVRNIAMAASWHLLDKPDFTRRSPFAITQLSFPLKVHDYDTLARCRLSGQRGIPAPELSVRELGSWTNSLISWAKAALELSK